MFDKVYEELNDNQKKAVDNIEGPVMVIAGAGTGKTKIIACRIARILKETDLDPSNILCMTFTEAGVTAMQNAVLKIIGPDAYKIKICTFHAFCNEVIISHPELFPQVNKEAEPITEVDKVRLVLELLNSLDTDSYLKPYSKPDNYLNQCQSLISKLKHEYVHPEEYKIEAEKNADFYRSTKDIFLNFRKINYHHVDKSIIGKFLADLENKGFKNFIFVQSLRKNFKELMDSFPDMESKEGKKVFKNFGKQIRDSYKKTFSESIIGRQLDFAKVYAGYQDELKRKQAYDFDDMIMYTVDAFKENSELLSEYQEQYQYILIDEYQDTNSSQNEAIFMLGSFFPNPNIFVVGDDDQSIFKFQGANTQNIFAFKEKYQDYLKIITLKDNYRSHQLILDASSELIDYNEARISKLIDGIDKRLTARMEKETRPIEVRQFITRDQESMFIADKITGLLKEEIEPQNIAILCRENKDVEAIREFLNKAGIAASRDEGEDVFNSVYIRQFINLLRFLINPADSVSLFLFLTSSFTDLNQYDVVKINFYANKIRKELSEVFLDLQNKIPEAGLSKPEQMRDISKKIIDWRARLYNTNAVIFFNELINESGLMKFLLKHKNYVDETGKLSRMYEEIKTLSEKKKDYTLVNFIEDLDLYDKYAINLIDSKTNLIENKVRLSTVHKAKGLEFDVVFMYNCVDGVWSNKTNNKGIKLPVVYGGKNQLERDNEEERRLFYVAMTRARKQLFMTYATSSDKAKSVKQPAQYIIEVPEVYLNKSSDETKESYIAAQQFVLMNKNNLDMTKETEESLRENIKNLKLTITHVNSYIKCPRCFFFNTILKIPKVKTESQSLGTVIHESLKFVQTSLNEAGEIPQTNNVLNRLEDIINREYLTSAQYESVLEKSKKLLEKFLTANKDFFVRDSITEKNMGPYSIIWEGIPIAGKIDLIKFNPDDKKNIEVIDFKTGNPDTKGSQLSQKSLGDYYRQLLFYKLLIETTPQLNWKVRQGIIKFIEPSREDGDKWVERSYDLDTQDYELLKSKVKEVYTKIQNLEFDECGEKCDNHQLHEINLGS